jgi:predicted N-acyltransferase
MVLELEATEDEQWGALRAKVRNQTRKAERSGLQLLPDGDARAFFAPFATNMRDLGTPIHPRRFFEAAAEAFGSHLRFIVTASEGRPVGGLVAIEYADCVSVPWAATYREERARCPNNQIYWEALRWAISKNVSRFDFGRSHRDAGTHRFKRGWGAAEVPLYWLSIDGDGSQRVPKAEALRGGLRIASACWSKLPIGLANWLGPRVRPHLLS